MLYKLKIGHVQYFRLVFSMYFREENPEFVQTLYQLEIAPDSCGLTLQSFLALPMQRVTRLPLLVDNICHRMDPKTANYSVVTSCLSVLQKVKCSSCALKARVRGVLWKGYIFFNSESAI